MIGRRLAVGIIVGLVISGSALPACTSTANVSEVWISIDDDGSRRRDVFFTDSSAVVCVAEIGIGRKDVTLELLIRKIRGVDPPTSRNFREENTVYASVDYHPDVTSGTPGRSVLKLVPGKIEQGKRVDDPEAPFEPGSYVCEVSIDGQVEKTASFNIDYPDCPTARIAQSQPCVGFYPLDPEAVCPRAGLTGDQQPTCACKVSGWECPP